MFTAVTKANCTTLNLHCVTLTFFHNVSLLMDSLLQSTKQPEIWCFHIVTQLWFVSALDKSPYFNFCVDWKRACMSLYPQLNYTH